MPVASDVLADADVAWVGRCTNGSAKLANILKGAQNIGITDKVDDRISGDRISTDGVNMWSDELYDEFGGVGRLYRDDGLVIGAWSEPGAEGGATSSPAIDVIPS